MIYLAGTFAYLKRGFNQSETLYTKDSIDGITHSGIETSQLLSIFMTSFSFIDNAYTFFSRTGEGKSFGYRSEEHR